MARLAGGQRCQSLRGGARSATARDRGGFTGPITRRRGDCRGHQRRARHRSCSRADLEDIIIAPVVVGVRERNLVIGEIVDHVGATQERVTHQIHSGFTVGKPEDAVAVGETGLGVTVKNQFADGNRDRGAREAKGHIVVGRGHAAGDIGGAGARGITPADFLVDGVHEILGQQNKRAPIIQGDGQGKTRCVTLGAAGALHRNICQGDAQRIVLAIYLQNRHGLQLAFISRFVDTSEEKVPSAIKFIQPQAIGGRLDSTATDQRFRKVGVFLAKIGGGIST